MAKGKIDANKKVLQKIFSQDFWFVVPEYQRSYVWQEDNVSELIEDLYHAYENKPENEYFLGSLVLKRVKNDTYPEYEVLDGQQRLTTFFMMLAVIRDLIENDGYKTNLQKKIFQEKDELDNIPSRQRITYQIRDKVEDFISKFIISNEGTMLIQDLLQEKEEDNISISNMADALLVIRNELKDKENLEGFVRFLSNNALFIYVSTDNSEDAFRMFTILNDRGVPLTSADIIKSMNIGALEKEGDIRKYARVWEEIADKHGDDFDRFLAFVRTVLVKDKARTNLLDEFENRIYKSGKLSKGRETFELLEHYNDVYENVIELGNNNLSNEFKNLITIMKIGLRSEDWIPPLMFYYSKFKLNRIDEFLSKLEYKFTGDWVCGITPTLRLEAMNDILDKIEATDEGNLNELLNEKSIFKINKETFEYNISSDVYKKQFVRYLLLKLEFILTDNTVHLSGYDYITVEHVLPQNPKEDSKWTKDFTDEERDKWTNKLANLVLINKRKNSSLSNLDFEEKKKRYLKKRIDAFQANKVFIQSKSIWKPGVLEVRQNKVVDLLLNG